MNPFIAFLGRLRPASFCLLAGILVACESVGSTPEGIVVAVYTDLAIGTELTSLTATVMDGDDDSPPEHTFTFAGAPSSGDTNFLVSFGVQRGQSGSMRLKLTGYRANDVGPPSRVIEQTLNARFIRGKTGLLHALLSRNCIEQFSCGTDQTCDPLLGMCGAVSESPLELRDDASNEKIAWLPAGYTVKPANMLLGFDGGDRLNVGGQADGGSDAMASPCQPNDTKCPEGCSFEEDSDCPRPAGEACALADQCQSESCLGNYCCEAACSDAHVFPSCQGGDCQAGICEEHYADCNHDKTADGCETPLVSDPLNCGACERVCPYGICLESDCAFALQGHLSKETHYVFQAGTVHGFRINSDHTGKLASLGMLIEEPNDAHLYIALFEDMGGAPFPRVIQSGELIVDGPRVEWIIPEGERPDILGGGKGYWFYFTFSKDTSTYASAARDGFWESTDTPEFVQIAEERPNDEYTTVEQGGLQSPSVFFNVVPSMSLGW